MRNEFNDNFHDFLANLVSDDYEYVTKISTGLGNWVNMPWADMRYKNVSEGFQLGFYIYSWFDLENKILNMGVIQGNNRTTNHLLKSRFDYIYSKFLEKFPKYSDSGIGDYFIKLKSLSYEDLNKHNLKQSFKEIIDVYESLIPDYIKSVSNEEPQKEDLRPENDGIRIWRIAPGSSEISNEVWDDFKKDSYVGVGFERDGDCPNFLKFKNPYAYNNYLYGNIFESKKSTSMIWKFVNWIREGDIVIVNKGRSKLAGIGIVTGEFIPKCENKNLKDFGLDNIRSVEWVLTPDDLEIRKNIFQRDTLEEWTDSPDKWNELVFTLSRTDSNLKNRLFEYIYSSFWKDYLNTEDGANHQDYYLKEEEYIKNTWKEISQKYELGENISEDIWEKIFNRDIKLHNDAVSDVKGAIQGKMNYSDEEMVNVARLFFETINRIIESENVDEVKRILDDYAENKYSRGFGTGRFSPVLHYLDDSYYVINNKTLTTINLLSLVLGDKLELDTTIKNYFSNNSKYKNFLEKLNEIYPYGNFSINDFHIMDCLCHWLNDKNLGNFIGKDSNLIPTDLVLLPIDPCDKVYELFVFSDDLDEISINVFKDFYCHIEDWKKELSQDGITIQEYYNLKSLDEDELDLERIFQDLVNEGLIKIVFENPNRYDVNLDEKNYLPVKLQKEIKENKLQGFAISDSTINRLCASLNAGKHIILDGTPGTGKTELAIKFSSAAHENKFIDGYVLTTATSDWSTFDTIGGLMPNDEGSLEFRQGKFLEAIEKNKWLIIDEINRADIDKAFGQLFTVLSGQNVELPYKENGKSIKIKIWDEFYCKHDIEEATYYIGTNWRIIGTMNVDDKDSLFDLSYAFMRRFMFIEVDLPLDGEYIKIIESWAINLDEYFVKKLIELYGIVKFRKLGPAIFKDMISYIQARIEIEYAEPEQILGETIDSYILPQLEGLNSKTIKKIEKFFEEIGLLDYISADKFNELTLDL